MKFIVIHKDKLVAKDQLVNSAVPLWKNEDTLEESSQVVLRVNEDNEVYFRSYIKYSKIEIYAARNSQGILEEQQTDYYQREPFASKKLSNGKKLYRRKHGLLQECIGMTSTKIQMVVPYDECKIDEVEIINCTGSDSVDLKVIDTEAGSYSGYPSATLEQFGFGVRLSDLYYTDTSNYDATLYQGMIVEITYHNNENDTKQIGANFVLHEVK